LLKYIHILMQNTLALQEQAQIDKMLISAGLPENKINSLLALAKDKLLCNSDCQKTRLAEKYKQQWDLAKQRYTEAPEEIELAEKNYYIYDKGYSAYKDMLYDRYAKSAEAFKTSSNSKYKTINRELLDMLDNYDAGTTYVTRMNELLQIKLAEQKRLKREIDLYNKNTQTGGRKVVYEDRERDWLTTVRKMIYFLYFGLLLWYIVFGNFFPNKEYVQWKIWLFLCVYILFPLFFLDRIVKILFAAYTSIATWGWSRNVYTSL